MFNGSNIQEKMCHSIDKFIVYENVASNKISLHHFKNVVVCFQQACTYLFIIFVKCYKLSIKVLLYAKNII